MAGNYPDLPNLRVPYDVDGTLGFRGGSAAIALTGADLRKLNSEHPTQSAANVWDTFFLIFPRLMDITHMYCLDWSNANGTVMYWSPDTTSGVDGTWNTLGTVRPFYAEAAARDRWRKEILPMSANGVRALRVGFQYPVQWHVYGRPSAGEDLNRVELWDPVADQALGPVGLDFGNAMRGTTHERRFRVKNMSPSLSTASVTLSTDIAYDAAPTLGTQWALSGGGAFGPTAALGPLAPGAVSPVCTLRYTVSPTAQLGVWAAKVRAVAGAWS